MERYTIRIVYRNRENPEKLVGLVEGEGIAGQRGFVGVEGLWRILNTTDPATCRGTAGIPGERSRSRAGTLVDLFSVLREE